MRLFICSDMMKLEGFNEKEKFLIPEANLSIPIKEITTWPIRLAEPTINDLYPYVLESQLRTKHALSQGLKFETSIVSSEEYLEKHMNGTLNAVVLYVDIADSTGMSMNLPAEKLATLIKIFVQEMSYLVLEYNGHVLKHGGDSVIAYFPADNNFSEICSNAVNCARSMMKVVEHAINPALREYGYPELRVKMGVDAGENRIVRLGNDIDLLGYTMSLTGKMVGIAKAAQIVIGKCI